jgi:hypothetical protein
VVTFTSYQCWKYAFNTGAFWHCFKTGYSLMNVINWTRIFLEKKSNVRQFQRLPLIKVKSWSFGFLYSDTHREISYQYHFTSWQATGKNNAWSSAHCGLRRVSPIVLAPAASLATCNPCSHTENINPWRKLVPIHRPRRDERLGRLRHLRVNPLPKDVTNWPTWQGWDSNPGLLVSSPAHWPLVQRTSTRYMLLAWPAW